MKIVKEYILREIAGEYILVPTGETTQEFNVREEYEVDEKTAFEDTAQMIHELLQYGFIECTKENKSW